MSILFFLNPNLILNPNLVAVGEIRITIPGRIKKLDVRP
jgi:hypothetical protein